MTQAPLTNEQLQEALAAVEEWGSVAAAARHLGLARETFSHRYKKAKRASEAPPAPAPVEFPPMPSATLSPLQIIEQCKARFAQLQQHEQAKVWPEFKVNVDGPFGICWFGDLHADDNGCNWPALVEHLRITRETPWLFGANLGDTLNNWVGKLEYLWSREDMSSDTAAVLARYLIEGHEDDGPTWHGGLGVKWLLWLMGNHDLWGQLASWMRATGAHVVPMYDWQARFVLVCPNGRRIRIWAAHDFGKFSSQWNDLHSMEKAAKMKDMANLYIGGHTHNWGFKKTESASRGFVFTLARVRGYKFVDEYGERLGHHPQQSGASIVTVIDPEADDEGLIECFTNVERGASYLTFLRSRR